MTLTKFGRVVVDPGGVYPPGAEVRQSAVLSEDQAYRYSLVRRWHFPGLLDLESANLPATFIMLNPSTADGTLDDPTVRRCVGFARTLECSGIVIANLYAYRATQPADLWRAEDPVGPEADRFIALAAERSRSTGAPLIAAWGAHARPDRVAHVLKLVDAAGARLTVIGTTKAGAPRHPLYLPGTAALAPWTQARQP